MAARRGLVAALTVIVALLLAATAVFAASAYGNRPPEMGIHYKRVQLQEPKTIGYRWFYAEDGRYKVVAKNWDYDDTDPFAGPLTYPAVDRVPAGEKLRLRISHPTKPNAFSHTPFKIRDFRAAASKGEGQWMHHKFVAVKRGGERHVAWDVVFSLEGKRPHYLRIYAGWSSEGPGAVSYGSVWRTAYLKTY